MEHNVGPVNAAPRDSGSPAENPPIRPGRFREAAIFVALSLLAGAASVWFGHRLASTAVIDIGPTDAQYVDGFRDIERDVPAYFRWSVVPSSRIVAPVRFCGPGSVRLRVRRHFVDPAVLTVSLGGAELGRRSVQARTDQPYDIIQFPFSKAICTSDASVLLETSVENDRALGVAVDWIQLRAESGFGAANRSLVRGGLALALLAFCLMAAGAGARVVGVLIGASALAIGATFAADPVAGERILRGGLAAAVLSSVSGLILARVAGLLGLSSRDRVLLVALTAVALAFRVTFLHPLAFYPDYRVHALVQETYTNLGHTRFMEQLFEIQYARSLGLQLVEGNWYPFPYPPGPYVLIGWVKTAFGLGALDAAIVTAATASALLPVTTVALGLRLGLGPGLALGGALFLALQPLLIRRLALGYFPGVIGQLLDALALLAAVVLLSDRTRSFRHASLLGCLFLGAFLVYTQSIANFGLLIGTLLVLELTRRTSQASGAVRVGAAALLALAVSVGLFYSRYATVMENVANRQPQPEARVLDRLEQIRQNALASQPLAEGDDENDPYAGATLNPLRGVARLGSWLWRFNGPFALAIAAGLWLLWRRADPPGRNLILAWGSVCLWISVLAAGLPSPNGFQHLKDLEFVSPLLALGLALLTVRLREARPGLNWAFAALWLAFALRAFLREFRDRLLPLAGL